MTSSGQISGMGEGYARIKKLWFKFSRNLLSVIGLMTIIIVSFSAIFANFIAPYPKHAGRFVDLANGLQPPSLKHLAGTDLLGRDVFSRIIFGFRYSLMMGVAVLTIVVPVGVLLGLISGYYRDTWVDIVIMRTMDIFVSVPALVLALAICAILEPSLFNSMMAISLLWWPWYGRLVYGISSSLRNEYFVQAAELIGENTFNILFKEILPNCLGPIFTRMSLDVGMIILLGSMLSFVGLGAQEPTPDLGTMVSQGSSLLPTYWWVTIIPCFAIVLVILGFNLFGDGIRDLIAAEEF